MKPFDLETALEHPEWVRHEDGTRATRVVRTPHGVRIEWSDGATGTYPVDSEMVGMDPPETCRWVEEAGRYLTGCNQKFEFTDGTPSENGFKFCPFCGKEISA